MEGGRRVILQFHKGTDGPYWVRPRYRREDRGDSPRARKGEREGCKAPGDEHQREGWTGSQAVN
jgi:hypothetical protein